MTRLENSEQKTFAPSAGQLDREGLSQSAQNFFQPIDRASAGQLDLPWALDFGTGTDLYQSAAYTGERPSLSALMADEPEQKLDTPKIQAASDALTRPSVIRTKEDEAIWDEMQKPHKLGKHESATHIGLSPEVIAEMQAKGQASKLEFFDSAAVPHENSESKDGGVLIAQVRRDNLDETFSQSLARLHRADAPPGAHAGVDYFDVNDFTARKGVQEAVKASPNLARNLAEIKSCKWSEAIHVWQHHPAAEYDAKTSIIEVDPKDSYKRQIEVFAHESYHATHQDLNKLYGGQKPVSETEYVNIKMSQEAGAFLRETLVNEDLTKNRPDLGNKPIEYIWVDPNDRTGEPRRKVINDLLVHSGTQIDEQKSQLAIEKFLREHPAAIKKSDGSGYERDKQGKLVANDYVEQKRAGFAGYSNTENFKKTKDHLHEVKYI